MRLFNHKINKKLNIKIWSLTQKYTKELTALYLSFYKWREIIRLRSKTDEILTELGII